MAERDIAADGDYQVADLVADGPAGMAGEPGAQRLGVAGFGGGPTSEPDRTLRRIRVGQRGVRTRVGGVVSVRSGSAGARL
jgi:hypothetical protein